MAYFNIQQYMIHCSTLVGHICCSTNVEPCIIGSRKRLPSILCLAKLSVILDANSRGCAIYWLSFLNMWLLPANDHRMTPRLIFHPYPRSQSRDLHWPRACSNELRSIVMIYQPALKRWGQMRNFRKTIHQCFPSSLKFEMIAKWFVLSLKTP